MWRNASKSAGCKRKSTRRNCIHIDELAVAGLSARKKKEFLIFGLEHVENYSARGSGRQRRYRAHLPAVDVQVDARRRCRNLYLARIDNLHVARTVDATGQRKVSSHQFKLPYATFGERRERGQASERYTERERARSRIQCRP